MQPLREPGDDDPRTVSELAVVIARYVERADPCLVALRQSCPDLASEIDAAHRGAVATPQPRRRGFSDEPLVPLATILAENEAARTHRNTSRTSALEALIDD